MIQLGEYVLGDCLRSSRFAQVHRAQRLSDGLQVLIRSYPLEPGAPPRARAELAVLSRVGSRAAPQGIAAFEVGERSVLVTEYVAGEDLAALLGSGALGTARVLELATAITRALSEIHAARLVHRDVRPRNLRIAADGRVCLLDFGLAVPAGRASRESPGASRSQDLPLYLAPERGAPDAGADCRSDLYSLGVTLYEMLVGRPPFESADPVALVHAHVALAPIPPRERSSEVPEAVSRIVCKLLQKSPADRYQSASGLLHDLESCREQWQRSGTIDPQLALATRDQLKTLHFPRRLYGRDAELSALQAAYSRVSSGAVELVLVSGPAGAGKTSLLESLCAQVAESKGFFAEARFEPYRRDVPYAAFRTAFAALVDRLLGEGEAAPQEWRDKLLESLGTIAHVMADLVPQLALLLGDLPPVPKLPPRETSRRLALACCRLLRVVATREHPVVLFLDDLQWADAGSRYLLEELLLAPKVDALLVVGAYRADEIDAVHPISSAVERLADRGVSIERLRVGPLRDGDTVQLLADTLRRSPGECSWIAAYVSQRSGNNPLLVRQLLLYLNDLGLLQCTSAGAATWDEQQILAAEIPGGSAQIMAAKIVRLPEGTRELLKFAAAIGHCFDVELLVPLSRGVRAQVEEGLDRLCEEELIAPTRGAFRFVHDRIRESAYSLWEEGQRARVHRDVARLLLDRSGGAERESRVFEIADHLSRARGALLESERFEAIEVHCAAGSAALRSGAAAEAGEYLALGRALARETDWRSKPELMYRLYFQSAQSAAAAGRIADARGWYEDLQQRPLQPLQRASVVSQRVLLCCVAGDTNEGIAIGLAGLREFGIRLPARPSRLRLRLALARANWLAWRRGDEGFASALEPSDASWVAQFGIMRELFVASMRSGSALGALLGCRAASEALRRGGVAFPATVVSAFAAAHSRAGRLSDARRLAQLAERFAERYPDPAPLRTALRLLLVHCWFEPRRAVLESFRELSERMMEQGDAQGALQSKFMGAALRATTGEPLAHAERAFREAGELSLRCDYRELGDTVGALRAIARLTGAELAPADLGARPAVAGESFVGTLDMAGLYILDRPAEVLERAREIAHWFDRAGFALVYAPDFHLYRALAAAALIPESPLRERIRLRSCLRRARRYFRRLVRHAPDCFEHAAFLLDAETARLAGQNPRAMLLYARASELAQLRGYQQQAAIAYERRASLCLEVDSPLDASVFLQAASHAYAGWGAVLKVQQLRAAYSDLLSVSPDAEPKVVSAESLPAVSQSPSTTYRDAHTLDLATVLRSSEAISGEVELDRVLERVMTIAIENAGAQRAVLMLDYDGELRIEAESAAGHSSPALHGSATVAASRDVLATHVVQYVQRTRKLVVLGHASVQGLFVDDPYVVAHGSKSILSLPIIRQAKLVGVLYLENDLVTNAFTEGRVEVLSLLSSHAAISLDNSRLYRQLTELNRSLEGRVEERTVQLREARDAAEDATRAKSEFLAVMSHEIRTPMNVVIGMAQLLMDMDLSGEQQECVQAVHTAGDSLLTVINDILDFSKIEAGRLELESTPFNVVDCIEEVGAILAPRAHAKGLEFPIVIDHRVPSVIRGDAARLKQVIINFVNNAIKFTERGEVEVHVAALESGPSDARLRIEVRDTGIGIPPDRLSRLFQSFSQVDASTTRKYGGTGLGLAISKRLVEAMGGRVGVSSEPGQGSTFWCDLRFALDSGSAAGDADRALARIRGLVLVQHRRSGEGVCEELRRLGLGALLGDGPQGLREFDSLAPGDVGVVFVRHPPPAEWIDALRCAGRPVYLMSMLTSRAEADQLAKELGLAGVLTWPVKRLQLRTALLRAVGQQDEVSAPRRGEPSEIERAQRSRFRILLAEDYELNQRLAVRLLDRAGYRCEVVDTGRKVIDRVQTGEYDLLLLDCQMPEVDGFDASRAIRRWELEHGGHIPIIAMTANAMQGDRERCLAAGMDEYLAKPIRVDTLYELLAKYLLGVGQGRP